MTAQAARIGPFLSMAVRPGRESGPRRVLAHRDLSSGGRIGPGKVAVLEQIGWTGSISAAARALKLSYRQTWDLIDDLNRSLGAAVIETAVGGSTGGGAELTEVGKAVVKTYRAIEVDAARVTRKHISALIRACPRYRHLNRGKSSIRSAFWP
jgi:molybdate transport system regulatory protein